ncbi:hypothetical protein FSP39_003982 [Pinctada imbricata]|uniref:G-protein coupled receptors family 1 profile domain-containing protein n=1 Tax=Pinctada imbricata TaxID=66713 RepID=A0AA89C528_PINIB|nr:hypothetical protein FSP39_003982 [Pinctada imbricata]
MTNKSGYDDLLAWNNDISYRHIWITIILVILLIVGVVGNAIVVLVYKFKMTGKIEDRFFIPILAAVDLVSCVLLIALSLTRTVSPVMFFDDGSCKALNYLAHASSLISLFLLVIIAIHRYQKICRPLGYQMKDTGKRVATGISCCAAIVLFSPLVSLYEVNGVTQTFNGQNVTGFVCSTKPSLVNRPQFIKIYQGFTLVVYILTILTIMVLYILVSRAIIHRLASWKRKKAKKLEKKRKKSATTDTKDSEGGASDEINSQISTAFDTLKLRKVKYGVKKEGHFSMYRYSYIFMIITLKAIISYIGPWIIVIYESSRSGASVDSMNLLLLKRMYILSHVTNPVIYGLLDKKFRKEMKGWFTSARKRRYSVSG